MPTLSTGMRDSLAVTGSIQDTLMAGSPATFKITVYDGPVPASANAALSGNTLLLTITNDADPIGLTLQTTATNGAVPKPGAEIWRGVAAASGTQSFFRISRYAEDPSTASTTLVRIQGSCAAYGADLNLGVASLTATTSYTIGAFEIRSPQ